MEIGDEVFITNVFEQEGDYNNNFKERKKAQVLKISGRITEIDSVNSELIKYSLGSVIHSGKVGFDCFLTKEKAKDRVDGLNTYFKQNNRLIEE